MSKEKILLGQKIRSLRLGYAYWNEKAAWVRVCEYSPSRWHVEIVPVESKLPAHPLGGKYYKDIKGQVSDILGMIGKLQTIKRFKKSVTFIVNDNGEIVA